MRLTTRCKFTGVKTKSNHIYLDIPVAKAARFSMQQRIIDPYKSQWYFLPTAFTEDKNNVFELFDAELAPEWGIYLHPHLNGLRPDFILLYPKVGIAAYGIQDRSPSTIRRSIEWDRTVQNPISHICRYKNEKILELYYQRLNDRLGCTAKQATIASLIYIKVIQSKIIKILIHHLHSDTQKYLRHYP